MGAELSEEQIHLRETVRAAAARDLRPLASVAEADEEFPRQAFKWAADLGLLGINFPERYGGGGSTKLTSSVVIEELGYVNSGIAGALMSQSGVATEAILKHGTEEQRRRFLPATLAGEAVAAIAITEPDAGSDVASVRSTATRDGDGYRLNGAKMFCSNASLATYICVLARMRGTERHDGLTLFVVEVPADGLTIGPPVKKLGHRAADTGQFAMEDVRVPAAAIVGEPGKGMEYIAGSLASGRVDFAARSVGVARAAFDEAMRYARERHQFGRPIAAFQATKFKLARMAMMIEVGRAITHRAARAYDTPDAVRLASMAKLHTAEAAQAVTWEALQIHGAYGYTREFHVEQLFRDARLFTLSEGTSEVQQLLIARSLGLS